MREISSLKFNSMVQTDISQLTRECNDWRETLRSHRDELHQMQSTLQQAVNHPLSKEEQTELEHLQNQLHIQLINIHDLKQAVKQHDRKLSHEVSGTNDFQFSDNVSAYHENLYENYHTLETSINELRNDLNHFVRAIH
jgi:chromosome segregation ATPase